jgi:hypothetical protein
VRFLLVRARTFVESSAGLFDHLPYSRAVRAVVNDHNVGNDILRFADEACQQVSLSMHADD